MKKRFSEYAPNEMRGELDEPSNEYANAVSNYLNGVDFKQYFKLETNLGSSLVFDVLSLHLHYQGMNEAAVQDPYQGLNHQKWCEEHGENAAELNAVDKGDGYPEDDHLESI